MENTETQESNPRESISSFRLTRNTKGYSWEIKVYDKDINKAYEQIQQMNEKAWTDYGAQNE
jgi:hypothetical protein